MKLTLKRIEKTPQYTLGNLYIDNVYFCDVLEDTDRGLKQSDPLNVIKSKKIYGKKLVIDLKGYIFINGLTKQKRFLL